MPAPATPQNVLQVFRAAKDVIETAISPAHLTVKSGGTRDLDLTEPISQTNGYWETPQNVSSKPPRWIVQIDASATPPQARFAHSSSVSTYPSAATVGYINNRDGSCAVAIFRVRVCISPSNSPAVPKPQYDCPDWEWLLVLGFSPPLPAGTSGDALSDFDPSAGTIAYGGGSSKQTFPIVFRGLVTCPSSPTGGPHAPVTPYSPHITYQQASEALGRFVHPNAAPGATIVFDGTNSASLQALSMAVDLAVLPSTSTTAAPPTRINQKTDLVGIPDAVYQQIEAALKAGKRHLIFYGPPGTGKTTLAEYVARELSENPATTNAYEMLTASSSWSSQDLIGGYQPLGPGKMGFIPGALLRHFDKPIVIDELNRCPIDKVIGPLFSVLSGQATTLPYRKDVADKASAFYVILPRDKPGKADHEYAPGSFWRLICTLNTIDKTQLGQISYALSRRFAWIKIGVPESLDAFLEMLVQRLFGIAAPASGTPNPISAMWKHVNAVREIGGAPIIDILKTARSLDPAFSFYGAPPTGARGILLSCFRMYILPLLDGLSRADAEQLGADIAIDWGLDPGEQTALARDLQDLSA